MMRRRIADVLCICMVLALMPTAVHVNGAEGKKSGSIDMDKLSKAEIVQLIEAGYPTLPDQLFDKEPSVENPYSIGKVNQQALQSATDWLNVMRRLAGLPSVTLDMALSESAQYGAVLTAHWGALSHHPEKPGDMDMDFYKKASEAVGSSNLSAGRALGTLAWELMNDSSSASNISSVGHRRWQLNPQLGKVGFGYAVNPNSAYRQFAVEKVFDKSGSPVDYDFIAWPASGNFPSSLFEANIPWSITVNPSLYQTPSLDSIAVTLTRESDGKIWRFSGSADASGAGSKCFNVDTQNYGVNNCIIFRPDGVECYHGVYTVSVHGLKTKSGGAVKDFTYSVEFFDDGNFTEEREFPSIGTGQFVDVSADSYYHDAIWWAVEQGIATGTDSMHFGPDAACTRAESVAFIWRAAGCPAPKNRETRFTDINRGADYYDAVCWSVEQGIISGLTDTRFGANETISRAQIVAILYRAAGSPRVTGSNAFRDVTREDYFSDPVQWAISEGIVYGVSDTSFASHMKCTRGQILSFLYRNRET